MIDKYSCTYIHRITRKPKDTLRINNILHVGSIILGTK